MTEKADYVRSQGQTRRHHCHWPGCEAQVPTALWGCRLHWYALPAPLRAKIWETFVPGQEAAMTPSAEYLEAATEVERWIKSHTSEVGR